MQLPWGNEVANCVYIFRKVEERMATGLKGRDFRVEGDFSVPA